MNERKRELKRMAARCQGCRYAVPVYFGDGDDLLTGCVYILRQGKRRPCPAGDGCTAYEPQNG